MSEDCIPTPPIEKDQVLPSDKGDSVIELQDNDHTTPDMNSEKSALLKAGEVTPAFAKVRQSRMEFKDAIPVSDDEDDPVTLPATIKENSVFDQSSAVSPPESTPNEEIDDLSIATEMNQYIQINRINLGEMSTLEDIWGICDAISAAHSGLPDSLLKEAFLLVLEGNYQRAKNNSWVRQHLDILLRLWKREVNSEKPSTRATKFVAGSKKEYSPPPAAPTEPKRKKVKKERKRALQAMMGVGSLLQQARVKFATEEGELDVDEDDYGNISIGGRELSFENWGELNKIRDDGIVHVSLPAQKRRRVRKIPSNGGTDNGRMSMPSPMIVQMPTLEEPIERLEPVEKPEKPATPKTEKDEGEISESDQSASSSTTSSSDEEGGSHARTRRTKRRLAERQQGGTSSVQNLSSIFSKCYEYRFKIAHRLSLQQKAQFLEILKQNKGASAGQKQQQQMTSQFMGSFMAFLQNRPMENK